MFYQNITCIATGEHKSKIQNKYYNEAWNAVTGNIRGSLPYNSLHNPPKKGEN